MLALALLGISSSAVLVRLANVPAPVAAFWRLALSLAVVAPFLLATGQQRALARMSGRERAIAAIAGVCLSLHLVTWFRSLEYTSVASSTVLVTLHPVLVGALSARWLREAPGQSEWLGIAVGVAGAVIVGWGDFRTGPDPVRGDALAVAAAAFVALYLVGGRHLRGRLGVWAYVAPVYVTAAAVTGVIAAAGGYALTGHSPETWWALAGLAAGPMLLGHTGFNWALRHVRAYVVSVVQLLEPIGATLLAVLVLGRAELPAWTTVLGGAVVLAGVWLSLRGRSEGWRPWAGAGAERGASHTEPHMEPHTEPRMEPHTEPSE